MFEIQITSENDDELQEDLSKVIIKCNQDEIDILCKESIFIRNLIETYVSEEVSISYDIVHNIEENFDNNDINQISYDNVVNKTIILIEKNYIEASKFLLEVLSKKTITNWNNYWAELSIKWIMNTYSELYSNIGVDIIQNILSSNININQTSEIVVNLIKLTSDTCYDISGTYRESYEYEKDGFALSGPIYIRSDNAFTVTKKYTVVNRFPRYYWVIESASGERIATYVCGDGKNKKLTDCLDSNGWKPHQNCPYFTMSISSNIINNSNINSLLEFSQVIPWMLQHEFIARGPIKSEKDLVELLIVRKDLRVPEIFEILSNEQKLLIFTQV